MKTGASVSSGEDPDTLKTWDSLTSIGWRNPEAEDALPVPKAAFHAQLLPLLPSRLCPRAEAASSTQGHGAGEQAETRAAGNPRMCPPLTPEAFLPSSPRMRDLPPGLSAGLPRLLGMPGSQGLP